MSFYAEHVDLSAQVTKCMIYPYNDYRFATSCDNIIVLKKNNSTITNENHITNVKHKNNVLYRGINFYVVSIINKWKPYEKVDSCVYHTYSYKPINIFAGTIVTDDEFHNTDDDMSKLFSGGIFFCSSLECAFYNSIIPVSYNGKWVSYHNNGQMKLYENFINGRKNGLFVCMYDNGTKMAEGVYQNGRKVGNWYAWNKNGERISRQFNYFDIL